MKPDLPPAISTAAEAEWINGELIRGLMRTARGTRLMGLLLVPLMVAVLWTDTNAPLLLLWAALALGLAALRLHVVHRYT